MITLGTHPSDECRSHRSLARSLAVAANLRQPMANFREHKRGDAAQEALVARAKAFGEERDHIRRHLRNHKVVLCFASSPCRHSCQHNVRCRTHARGSLRTQTTLNSCARWFTGSCLCGGPAANAACLGERDFHKKEHHCKRATYAVDAASDH